MVAMLLLLQLARPAEGLPRSLLHHGEEALWQRIIHTAFDPAVIQAFPGLLSATEITASMQRQLPQLKPQNPTWTCTKHWSTEDLRNLQSFWIYLKMHGHAGIECGPTWAMQRKKAQVAARLGSQRAPSNSRHGLDHLLPPGWANISTNSWHVNRTALSQQTSPWTRTSNTPVRLF